MDEINKITDAVDDKMLPLLSICIACSLFSAFVKAVNIVNDELIEENNKPLSELVGGQYDKID